MTYKLEFLSINETEDLFYSPADNDLFARTVDKHLKLGSFNNYPNFISDKHQAPSGEWVKTNIIEGFCSISSAEDFFLDVTDRADHLPIRIIGRAFNISHNVIAQHSILDNDNIVVKRLHHCGDKCFRYGDCPPPEDGRGCGIYPSSDRVFHVDISSLSRVK